MADTFKDFGTQLKNFYNDLSIERKIAFGLVIIASFIAIYFLANYALTPQYGVLYSNLNTTSASSIVQKLTSYVIPYKLSNEGRTILVPKNDVYSTRLKLASEGLPRQAGVGFSLFNKVQIGMTDFMQHVDYQRALQGELERTINDLSQIEYSRVLIVLPRQSIFVSNRVPAKASVIVKLKSGFGLSKMQVSGIKHLVASAVEGLNPKNVTIVDTDGRILSAPTNGSFEYSDDQLSYVKKIEKNLEGKINAMLVPVVGQENVKSKVFVKVDFTKKEESKLTYNPNTTAIVSQQTSTTNSVGAVNPSGAPGTPSNLPPGKTQNNVAKPSSTKTTNDVTNYDVSKTIEKISYPTGNITQVFASVLVNGTYKKVTGTKGESKMEYVPRSASELSLFKSIVETAIGYSKTEGDKVVVANIPFKKTSYAIPKPPKQTILSILQDNEGTIIKYSMILIGIALLILMILRPMLKYITSYKPTVSNQQDSEQRRLETLTQIKEESVQKPEPNVKDTAVDIVKSDPESATNYVKNLLKETNREV